MIAADPMTTARVRGLRLQGGAHYASPEHVARWMEHQTLPPIHDDMGIVMAQIPASDRRGAIDLGACHGLLAVRARMMGWATVLGIEPDEASVAVFDEFIKPTVAGVTVLPWSLDACSINDQNRLATLMAENRVTTILARRALPETLSSTYGRVGEREEVWRYAGTEFSKTVIRGGARWMVVEGRVNTPRATHPLCSIEREIDALGPFWTVAYRHRETVLLRPT